MEQVPVVGDTLRQNGFPKSEMINRDKHGAVVELTQHGTPRKVFDRILDISTESVRRILARPEWTPYKRRPVGSMVLAGFEEFLSRRAPEVDFNTVVIY